jgi:hypothetical protein
MKTIKKKITKKKSLMTLEDGRTSLGHGSAGSIL